MPKAHQPPAEYSLNFIMENARKIGINTLAYIEHMINKNRHPNK
jgi:hypothetical protein